MGWILDETESHIIKEIEHGTDRQAAIVAAAFLERQLGDTLHAVFEEEEGVSSRMLKGYGPLATFSAKIDLGYLLRIYKNYMRKWLYTLKDIRNEFAHRPEKTNFKTQKISDLCKNLPGPVWKKSSL